MKNVSKSLLRSMALTLAPGLYRKRLFGTLDHPTKKAILEKSVDAEICLLPALLLGSSGAFIDVGANVGTYTYAALHYLSPDTVYAVEPQPVYVKALEHLFAGAHVVPLAFSDSAGTARFKVPEIHGVPYPTRGTLESFNEEKETGAQYETVTLDTLDAFCVRESVGPVSLIKIDVEGHELAVLHGAKETIERYHPALIIEIEQRHHTAPIEPIFKELNDRDYTGWFFDSTAYAYVPLTGFDADTHQQPELHKTAAYVNNFVFLPESVSFPDVTLPL